MKTVRTVRVPVALLKALESDTKLVRTFKRMPLSKQREFGKMVKAAAGGVSQSKRLRHILEEVRRWGNRHPLVVKPRKPEARVSLITLGVGSLETSYRFYGKGLGWPTSFTPSKGVIFFQTRGTCLALYPLDKLMEDVGKSFVEPKPKFPGITLAYNARTRDEVDAVLEAARQAGGKIEKPAQETFWGGYSGYFSDPDGYLWEVAYGAFEIRKDGSLVIP